ncbi:unnamed protein product [Symbiodinium necroappetens]|uniref:Uncharacterized protein n=1 Tax=Symbiodinium necroappetens TaxID=1628268 RepID=A0A813CGE2_9DINO|nr:unnamed protein product [Symbiodinium necroappetens]
MGADTPLWDPLSLHPVLVHHGHLHLLLAVLVGLPSLHFTGLFCSPGLIRSVDVACRVPAGADLHHVAELVKAYSGGVSPGVFDVITPVRPLRFAEFAEFVRLPHVIRYQSGMNMATIILDLTRVGGNYFPYSLPRTMGHQAFLDFIQDHIRVEAEEVYVFVGTRPEPWPKREPFEFRDGDAVILSIHRDAQVQTGNIEALFLPEARWGDVNNLPRLHPASGVYVLHGPDSYFIADYHHSGVGTAKAVSDRLRTNLQAITTCSFESHDFDFGGKNGHTIFCVADLPWPHADPLQLARRDIFILCDLRALGKPPEMIYTNHPVLHLPSVCARFGLRLPPSYKVLTIGGREVDEEVFVDEHSVLVFTAVPVTADVTGSEGPADSNSDQGRERELPSSPAPETTDAEGSSQPRLRSIRFSPHAAEFINDDFTLSIDSGTGGVLGIILHAPYYQEDYLAIFFDPAQPRSSIPDRIRASEPRIPLDALECIVPIDPLPDPGFGAYLAYPPILDSNDLVAVLVDLRPALGTKFAAILPKHLPFEAWDRYVKVLLPTRHYAYDVFLGTVACETWSLLTLHRRTALVGTSWDLQTILAKVPAGIPEGYQVHIEGAWKDNTTLVAPSGTTVTVFLAKILTPVGPPAGGRYTEADPSAGATPGPTDRSAHHAQVSTGRSTATSASGLFVAAAAIMDTADAAHFGLGPSYTAGTPGLAYVSTGLCWALHGLAALGSLCLLCWICIHMKALCHSRIGSRTPSDKLLTEPVGDTPSGNAHLDRLRALTAALGGRWLRDARPIFPGAVEEIDGHGADPSLQEEDDTVLHICCIILKVGHTPEEICVALAIPATQEEAETAVLAARDPAIRRIYPSLVPVTPQPLTGNAVFLAGPAWIGILDGCCFDTTAVDGRLFAIRAPDYISRHELVSLAHFQDACEVEGLVGTDQEPLLDEVPIHLFPGMLVTFLPAGEQCTVRYTLGQQLQTRLVWSEWSLLEGHQPLDAYCLVCGDSVLLHFADPGAPKRYRDHIADTANVPVRSMRIQAAQPRPTDVALWGFACRSVLVVSSFPHTHPEGTLHHCLLDCRPLCGTWQALRVHMQGQRVQDLLPQITDLPPLGHRLRLCPGPGCILVAEYDSLQDSGDHYSRGAAEQEDPVQASSTGNPGPEAISEASATDNTGPPEEDSEEYSPELIALPRRPPTTLVDLLAALEQHRDLPPTLLALPHWHPEGIAVLIDCRLDHRRVFAVVLPFFVYRDDVARVAGIDTERHYHVYAKDVPWPTPAGHRIYLTLGDRLLICDTQTLPGHPVDLPYALGVTANRDYVLPPSLYPSDCNWVLSDGIHTAVAVRSDHFATDSLHVALALALPAGHFLLVPAVPPIIDHANRGTYSQGVFIACQTEDYPPAGHGRGIPFVLDPRAILLPLSWAYAPEGRLDVAALCNRLAVRCPSGYHVRLYGGEYEADQGNHVRHISAGDVLVAEFQPNYVRDVVSQLHPASFAHLIAAHTPGHLLPKVELTIQSRTLSGDIQVNSQEDSEFPNLEALWLAATLLETLVEHFEVVDLSAVSLPLHQGVGSLSIDMTNRFDCLRLQTQEVFLGHARLTLLSDCLVALQQTAGQWDWQRMNSLISWPNLLPVLGALDWLWLHIESTLAPEHWPRQVGSSFVDLHRHTDDAPLTPEESHAALGLSGVATESTHKKALSAALRFMTINVQSLADKDSAQMPGSQPDTFQGKARYLREQLQHGQIQVAALQEARAPEDATFISDTHIRICTGRDPKGNFGCELWFSRTLPFLFAADTAGTFHPKDLLTLATSPRMLLVKFTRAGLNILFAAYMRQSQGALVVLIGDYNTSFSLEVHNRVGDLVWPAKHSVPEGLTAILQRHDLWLPSTYSACHEGQHDTWISPTGTKGARLDYLAIPSSWHVPPASSWVDVDLDWGQARVDHYGLGGKTPSSGHLQPSTFAAVVDQRPQRQLARLGTTLKLAEVQAALRAWFRDLISELQTTKGRLRHLIRTDVRQRIQETAAAAAAIPRADVVTRLRPLLGPPRRRQKQRQTLKTVVDESGAPASTPEQAEDLWLAHFAGLEAGVQVDPTALARSVQEAQQTRDLDAYALSAGDLPSRVSLELSLRKTQTGRAQGTDNIPGEVLHFAAGTASKALFQLFLKISLRSAEPLQFKGGTLYAVWKGKNNPSICSSHRGILVSSTTGKAFHRLLRDRAVGTLQNVSADMQIGGLPKFPVVLASHYVRLFQEGCQNKRRSHGLLFLDFREAFYRVVRPLLTGTANKDEDIAAILRAVHLPPGVMHELHAHLKAQSLAREAGAPPWTDFGLKEALDGTWFRFQGGHKVVCTSIGSRPGDNLADVCFSFIFAKVLAAIRDDLDAQCLLPEVPWHDSMLCNVMPTQAVQSTSIRALDATWMDDASFVASSDTAEGLVSALKATGTAVIDALWPSAQIRLVSTYQHLGGFIHHAFNAKKKAIFASPGVDKADKKILFELYILAATVCLRCLGYPLCSGLEPMAGHLPFQTRSAGGLQLDRVGNKRTADEGKFQAPSLQAQGPVLSLQVDNWVPYLERPSIEVLDCLHFVDFDLEPANFTEAAVKERARLALCSVCLPLPKIRATVRAWSEQIHCLFAEAPVKQGVCQTVIHWILNCDLVQWLVPAPRGKVPLLHTFQQAEDILIHLDHSGITPPEVLCPRDPTLIRVGPADWLRGLPDGPISAVDFTHEECLEAFRDGRTPCFIEDPPTDVIFLLSVRSLPGWSARPLPPVKDRAFSELLDQATLHYDLVRFALRLWIAGIPTALIADCLSETLPTQVQTLPFLATSPCLVPALICTGNFAWEPFLFHFL